MSDLWHHSYGWNGLHATPCTEHCYFSGIQNWCIIFTSLSIKTQYEHWLGFLVQYVTLKRQLQSNMKWCITEPHTVWIVVQHCRIYNVVHESMRAEKMETWSLPLWESGDWGWTLTVDHEAKQGEEKKCTTQSPNISHSNTTNRKPQIMANERAGRR